MKHFRLDGNHNWNVDQWPWDCTCWMALGSMRDGHFVSDHDLKIALKVAHVMTGGDCSPRNKVTEQYLLDLEREAFLSLCGEEKSQARIAHMLETNKPLRN